MNEPCVCDGSGTTPQGFCRWCNAGEEHRQAVGSVGLSGHIRITSPQADHKDTTQTHE